MYVRIATRQHYFKYPHLLHVQCQKVNCTMYIRIATRQHYFQYPHLLHVQCQKVNCTIYVRIATRQHYFRYTLFVCTNICYFTGVQLPSHVQLSPVTRMEELICTSTSRNPVFRVLKPVLVLVHIYDLSLTPFSQNLYQNQQQ
jgi:tRNA(Phe) wybutosine-synthesizing methylase Tyw3